MNQYLTRPVDVRAVDLGHALVLLHERTGAVWTLIGTQRQTWVELAATGATTSAAAADLAKRLRTTGLLAPTEADEPRPWPAYDTRIGPTRPSWGTQEVPGALAPAPRFSRVWAPAAAFALLTVHLVRVTGRRSRGFARMLRLVHATRLAQRAASPTQAARVLDCVRVIGRLSPFRTACLEETVAAMLALAMTGRRAGWCHGIAADPIRLHAWLSLDGCPVGEPTSTLRFTPLIQLPEPAAPTRDRGRAARGDTP